MTSYQLFSFLKSLTVVIPLAIVLIRYNKIERSYQPFIIYLLVAFITEVVTFIYIAGDLKKNNAPISNIYVLIEWLLILWQFNSWGIFKKMKTQLYLITAFVIAVWIIENVFFRKFFTDFSPYYRVLYYFTLVLISINVINHTIINDNKNIFHNARFLICLSFIIIFVYKLIYEWAFQYSFYTGQKTSGRTIITAFGYVNAFQKLLCAVAAFYIPERNQFEIKSGQKLSASGEIYNNEQ